MTKSSVDLASLFGAVAENLAQNQEALNEADRYNHDHGTNMVQTFETIANALEKKQDASDSAALAYAAKQVAKKTTSGSSRLYAENLNQAASQFRRRKVDEKGAFELLQTLIGGAQPPTGSTQPAGDDLLGALMGGMAGGSSSNQGSSAPDAGDLLGALMGGMAGGGSSNQGSSAPDAGDLLGALMAGMAGGDSSNQGSSAPDAGDLLGALMGGMAGGGSSSQSSSAPDAGDLLGALMGGMAGGGSNQGSSAPDAGDLLGALMGGMGGSGSSQSSSSPGVGDLLGALMGGMSGSSGSSSQQQGLNLQNLLAAGMAYMQAKQSGKDTLQALIQAFVAGSNMGKDPYRTQSTQLVVQSFLQALGSQPR